MSVMLRCEQGARELAATSGDKLLCALQDNDIPIGCACEGAGTCHTCCVLVHDKRGVSYRRACEVQVSDGIEVVIEQNEDSVRTMSSMQSKWGADGDGWGYGFAIDVGTDTVVCRLYDLETGRIMGTSARTNPQVVFGTDLSHRIKACERGYVKAMSHVLGDVLVDMASALARQADIELAQVTYTVLAGNTVMEHIAADVDASSINISPHAPLTRFGTEIDYIAFERGNIAAGTTLFATCISGFVGGDFTCSLLAIDILHANGPSLLLDLGASAEMALGDGQSVTVTSVAVASLFEGGGITYGMPVRPGAIAKLVFSSGCFVTTTIAGAEPLGVACTGLIDCVALMLDYGVVDPSGRILEDDEINPVMSQGMERFLCTRDGQRCIQLADDVFVSQDDIEMLQKVKAAVRAGIDMLIERRGIEMTDIRDLAIAGGFGQFLNMASASRIGLIPYELLYCARAVGNTALEGASALLISDEANDELDAIVSACTCIDLADTPEYESHYDESLLFGLCAC